MSVRRTVVILGAPGVPAPHNLDTVATLADVRECTADTLGEALPGADVVVVWDFFSGALAHHWGPATRELRWVHVCAAGVDSVLFDELRTSPVVVTNASGVFDGPIAEFVLASILSRDKRLHESKSFQRQAQWRHRETRRTAGTSALVIGTGGIGRAIATLLRAVGIGVTGAGRTARTDDPDFGIVHDSARLREYVGDFDNVIAVAPLTPATRHLIDARVLAAMRPDAHLINVGRGPLIDEPALIAALRDGRIGAASLDVFTDEPLDPAGPLWAMDNVAISPHMSGDVTGWRDTLADAFLANLRRYVARGTDEPADVLHHVVDKKRGYISHRSR